MERLSIHLSFADEDLARDIAKSKPPRDVKVNVTHGGIQASEPALIVSSVFINFAVEVSAIVVGTWLYDTLKKRRKKSTSINRRRVPIQKREIVRLIKRELANERRREAQWREVHDKKT